MPRDTLLDFFADLATLEDNFLVWDDGYRTHQRSYAEVVARGARVRRKAARAGHRQRREGGVLVGEPAGMDCGAVGVFAGGSNRGADRFPQLRGVS